MPCFQIFLKWESPPQTVLFVTKPNSNSVHALCAEMVRYVTFMPYHIGLKVYQLSGSALLNSNVSFFSVNYSPVCYVMCIAKYFVMCISCRWLKEHNNINVFVEPRVSKELLTEDSYFNFIETWDNGRHPFLYI